MLDDLELEKEDGVFDSIGGSGNTKFGLLKYFDDSVSEVGQISVAFGLENDSNIFSTILDDFEPF